MRPASSAPRVDLVAGLRAYLMARYARRAVLAQEAERFTGREPVEACPHCHRPVGVYVASSDGLPRLKMHTRYRGDGICPHSKTVSRAFLTLGQRLAGRLDDEQWSRLVNGARRQLWARWDGAGSAEDDCWSAWDECRKAETRVRDRRRRKHAAPSLSAAVAWWRFVSWSWEWWVIRHRCEEAGVVSSRFDHVMQSKEGSLYR